MTARSNHARDRPRSSSQPCWGKTGQDLEQRENDVFRIARGVAEDRVISTVDPEARHGHKTAARGFDGYKGHVSVDPDSEIIVATEVTAGNVRRCRARRREAPSAPADEPVEIYGDSSYGTAELVEQIEAAGAEANTKVHHFARDDFRIDPDAKTVACPGGALVRVRVRVRVRKDGSGLAIFAPSSSHPGHPGP